MNGLQRWLTGLLAIDDPPPRVAAAFAIGTFFSFSPFLGLQTVLAMAVAFVFRLNKIAVFLGLNTNLPWFMVPWYATTTVAAAAVMGISLPPVWPQIRLAIQQGALPRLDLWTSTLAPLLWPLLAGASVGAAVVAAATYAVARRMLEARARHARRASEAS